MRFVIDAIVAITFWSVTIFSASEVYDFFKKGAIQNVERGLSSTEKFSKALTQQ